MIGRNPTPPRKAFYRPYTAIGGFFDNRSGSQSAHSRGVSVCPGKEVTAVEPSRDDAGPNRSSRFERWQLLVTVAALFANIAQLLSR
jgi:hypothetical protein